MYRLQSSAAAVLLTKRPMEDLFAARARYLDGEANPPGVRPVVLSSWQRSAAYGIHPERLQRQSRDTKRLERAREAKRSLLDAAKPFLELVHATLQDQPHLVVLCDPEGLVLRALAQTDAPDDLETSNLFEGASWHERDIGCNGIGTALAIGEPVILIGPEHFQESYVGWTCIGVPIRDPDGRIAGAVDLSVPNEHTHVHAWGWILSIAKAIEGKLARGAGRALSAGGYAETLNQPLHAVRGVFDLLAQQLDLPPTHTRFLDEGRAAIEAAEEQLALALNEAYRSARAARRELSEITAIYDTAPVGLCVLDRSLRFVRVNERLAEINGISAAEHIGRSVRDVLPGLADVAEPLFHKVLETGEPVMNLELSGETPALPGVVREWIEHYLPLKGEDGQILGINVVVVEVTEQRRAEKEIREAYRAAETAVEARDNVLAVVSHDLRTPLDVILLASYLLSEDLPEEKKGEQTTIIRRSADQMRRLLQDLLDISQIEGEELEVSPAPCAADDLVTAAVQTLSDLARSRGILLQSTETSEGSVIADRGRILQVFANLISNAIDHTPEGGTIEVAATDREGKTVFSVRDTGTGMSPSDAGKVFDRFWRKRKSKRVGAGLGLAIAKGIVEAHGGCMWVESEESVGSCFFFSLPLAT